MTLVWCNTPLWRKRFEPVVPAVDVESQPAAPASAGPKALPSTLTAAKEAAEFVARIFAETEAEKTEAAEAESTVAEVSVDEAVAEEVPAAEQVFAPLAGQKVLILGLGASGLAMARWCVLTGAAKVTVADTRETPPQLAVLQQELPQVRFVAGPFAASLVEGRDLNAVYRFARSESRRNCSCFRSCWRTFHKRWRRVELVFHGLGSAACRARIPARGAGDHRHQWQDDGHLAYRSTDCPCGQNRCGGRQHRPHAVGHADAAFASETLPDVWVLELSSFQLDAAGSFEPTAAVVLNVTQDHLDWHGSMQAYAGPRPASSASAA